MHEQPAPIFIPVRLAHGATTPEQMLTWIRSLEPQHDGRIYIRVSEVRSRFRAAEMFYHIVTTMYRQGMVEVERWYLEKLGPRKPKPKESWKNAPSPWDRMEVVYAILPIDLAKHLDFECYVDNPLSPRAFSQEERLEIWTEWSGMCAYCEKPIALAKMAIDHDIPLSRGGSHHRSNLVCACEPCNTAKHARTADEYLRYLAEVRT